MMTQSSLVGKQQGIAGACFLVDVDNAGQNQIKAERWLILSVCFCIRGKRRREGEDMSGLWPAENCFKELGLVKACT